VASAIEICAESERIEYERLTLLSLEDGRPLVKDLSVVIPHGTRVLIAGPDHSAPVALFRATAGIWAAGEGRILRPGTEAMLFLPEHPYLPPGTLKESLLHTGQESVIGDERILNTLRALDLDALLSRTGGLAEEKDWDNVLSLGEQQLLACARVFIAAPRFVFLDRINTALSRDQVERILRMLTENAISYVNIGEAGERRDYYDAVLEFAGDGEWKWTLLR
jgi:putative ATP-binding cassette transporter